MNPNQPDMRTESPLSSWKEIAAYLQRNVATVRRWEKSEGLPVHRHGHQSRSSVYAFQFEIDAWRAGRKVAPEPLPLWKALLAPPRSLAFGATLALCLVMVGNGIRPQAASAQEVSRRRVWTGPTVDRDAKISRDGRYFVFMAKKDGVNEIAIRDVATGLERNLTNQATASVCRGSVDIPTISHDATVVYAVWGEQDSFEVCIVNVNGDSKPRSLYHDKDVPYMDLDGWSPDGKQLAVAFSRGDRVSRIGLLSVSDGSLKVLKSVGWDVPNEVEFSPDGKYLAYDLMRGEDREGRDIFILAADGSTETLLVNTGFNSMLGWSGDGKRVVFLKDRNGDLDIWAAPVNGNRPDGAPSRVLANTGNLAPGGLTASGALYYAVAPQRSLQIRLGSIDLNAGTFAPLGAATPGSAPHWSPDGRYVAFLASQPRLRRNHSRIGILTVNTGEVRYLRPTVAGDPRWSPDGRSLAVWGPDPRGRYGIYRVDVQSGDVSPIVTNTDDSSRIGLPPEWSPDQRKIYYRRGTANEFAIVERTLETGMERELVRLPEIPPNLVVSPDGKTLYYSHSIPNEKMMAFSAIDLASGKQMELYRGNGGGLNLSRDGRYIATVSQGSVLLIPVDGGPHKELLHAEASQRLLWAPDSQSVFLRQTSPGEQAELWRVPLSGGQPQKTPTNLPFAAGLILSPNGRQIAYLEDAPRVQTEILVIENFLPKIASK